MTKEHGGLRVPRGDNRFAYAAVATQFFASALAINEAGGDDGPEHDLGVRPRDPRAAPVGQPRPSRTSAT